MEVDEVKVEFADGGVALVGQCDEHARRSRGKMGEVTAESRVPVIYDGHVRT